MRGSAPEGWTQVPQPKYWWSNLKTAAPVEEMTNYVCKAQPPPTAVSSASYFGHSLFFHSPPAILTRRCRQALSFIQFCPSPNSFFFFYNFNFPKFISIRRSKFWRIRNLRISCEYSCIEVSFISFHWSTMVVYSEKLFQIIKSIRVHSEFKVWLIYMPNVLHLNSEFNWLQIPTKQKGKS